MPFVAKLAEDLCTGCKQCILACPDPNVIRFNKNTEKVDFYIEKCKGCGLCAEVCKFDALKIVLA
ncbi:MAG: 4Fe-4S binding protein [Methanocellales archaeon]|nr:4Fe-4S binding protein [Methanocellales archaeon]